MSLSLKIRQIPTYCVPRKKEFGFGKTTIGWKFFIINSEADNHELS